MKRNPPRPTPGDDPLVGRRRSGLCRRGRRARPFVDGVVDRVRRLSQARLQLAGSTQAICSKAFCLWMEPARLPSRPRHCSGRSIWVFLARGRFAAKTPAYEGWISLDFLGFSRPNLYLSTGYAGKASKCFSRALLPLMVETPRREPEVKAMRSAELFIGRA